MVLGKEAKMLICYFFDNRLSDIRVIWEKQKAPGIVAPLSAKYGPPDDVDDSGNMQRGWWYIGDTQITIILEDNDTTLYYSSISIESEQKAKEGRDVLDSL